jgi:hypothetical protein
MTPTIYFAESCPYGIDTRSDGDQLVRFLTAAERDAWVSDDHRANPTPTRRALCPTDAGRIHELGDAICAGIIRDGLFVPPEYAPSPPEIYTIGE